MGTVTSVMSRRGHRPGRHGPRAHSGLFGGPRGEGFAEPNPRPMFPTHPDCFGSSRTRMVCASGSGGGRYRKTAEWAAEKGMNLMSSTLLGEDTGIPFHQLQAEQIERFRKAWANAGHLRQPRISVSRSIFPIVSDLDRAYFGREANSADQVGFIDGGKHASARPTPGSPSSSLSNWPRMRQSPPPTLCC